MQEVRDQIHRIAIVNAPIKVCTIMVRAHYFMNDDESY